MNFKQFINEDLKDSSDFEKKIKSVANDIVMDIFDSSSIRNLEEVQEAVNEYLDAVFKWPTVSNRMSTYQKMVRSLLVKEVGRQIKL